MDIEIIDTITADTIEVGDQIAYQGDHVEVTKVGETDDIDEVVVEGYSHESGDNVRYSLKFTERVDLWTV